MLKINEINKKDEFFNIKNEWNKVLNKCRDRNVFLTWEYLSTYWRHFGKDNKLRILYIEDNNEIIAIAPLRQSRFGYSGPLGYDVIEPLGYRGLTPEGADYTGLILTEREVECLKLFFNYLVEHDDWDFIYMYDIPGTSMIPDLLPNISKVIPRYEIKKGEKYFPELKENIFRRDICPYISIPNSLDTFMKDLSSKFLKNLRRCMRNLQKDYQSVDMKRHNEFGSVEKAMSMFFELHQERWKSKYMPGVFYKQEIRDFYIDVAKLFEDNGWLNLYFLTANDDPIATHYCFEYKQKMYEVLGGLDPDYSKYSVGNLLRLKIIEKCIEKKIEEYDMMKGSESYKFNWTTKYRRNLSIKFVNKKLTSNIYNWGINIIKQIKLDKIIGRI